MARENGVMILPTVLVHYGSFEPLWQQPGMIQAGPNISSGPTGIHLPRTLVPELLNKLKTRAWNGRGILLHYTDPFILRTMPLQGIHHWPGPKILACGDLHHGPQPLETLTAYQHSEAHDAVLLTFNPALLQDVRNALNVPVRCLAPSFFRYPSAKRHPKPKLQLLHVGSLGPHHTRRRDLVQTLLKRRVVPFHHTTTTNAEEAAKLYAEHALVLNIPLNNDLNHRCFEIIAAGTPQLIFGNKDLAGNLHALTKRPDLMWVHSVEEIENLVQYLLTNPNHLHNIQVATIPYWDLKDLVKQALSP